MRIDPKVVVSPIKPETSSKPQPKPTAAPNTASVVALSSAASSVKPEGAQSSTVAARIDKIRALLDAGHYPVDLDLLASRIVDDEALRGGGGSSK